MEMMGMMLAKRTCTDASKRFKPLTLANSLIFSTATGHWRPQSPKTKSGELTPAAPYYKMWLQSKELKRWKMKLPINQ
jgi:hypothetical protein